LMSQISIQIENALGGNSNTFAFLSFYKSIKLGWRNTIKMYKVATILMNMWCTFYCCQFTNDLQHQLRMSIEELLDLCKQTHEKRAVRKVRARLAQHMHWLALHVHKLEIHAVKFIFVRAE
jgi:hypothetical protein